MNEWSHLPNAAHIDAVIASVAANPDQWSARETAWIAARETAETAALRAAWDAVWTASRNAAWIAARDRVSAGARDAAWIAAAPAVMALIAYDDCAYILSMPPDQARVLAGLGLPAAALLLPAAIAFESIKELSYE